MKQLDPVYYIALVTEGKTPTRLDLTERVRSFSFEDEESKADKLSISLDNFDLLLFENEALMTKGSVLEVSWGYHGRMSPARRCVLSSIKGSVVLKVEALSKEFVMHRKTKTRSFENMKRSDVAREIAREQGYTSERMFIQDTVVVLPVITQASTTDLHLMRDLATREGFEFFVDFDGFHFHERNLGQKPIREFVWYMDQGSGDVLSWDITSDLYKGKIGGVTLRGIDPLTKGKIEGKADNQSTKGRDALAPSPELVTAVNLRDGTLTTTEKAVGSEVTANTTEQTTAGAKRAADGLYKKSQNSAFELTLECIGDPDLVAKSVVRVSGIGSILSGNYYVKGITHKIGPGYTMTLKLRRDGKNSGTVTTTGTVNTANAPQGSNSDSPPPPLDSTANLRTGEVNWNDSRGRKN